MQGMAGMMAGAVAQRATGAASNPTGQRPNLLIVLTDDQHYQAMACAGNPIMQTPQMDALAAQGTLFTNAFVPRQSAAPAAQVFSRACMLAATASTFFSWSGVADSDICEMGISDADTAKIPVSTVICAPVYTAYEGLSTQAPVGPDERLKQNSASHCDVLVSLQKSLLTQSVDVLSP